MSKNKYYNSRRLLQKKINKRINIIIYQFRKFVVKIFKGKEQYFFNGTLLSPLEINNKWIFHNEDWIRVIHRKKHRQIVKAGIPLEVQDNWQEPNDEIQFQEDGSIIFDGKTKSQDEWLYLYIDTNKYIWENYSWQFSVCRRTSFRELQFGFRYNDFYNRYRFRFEDNKIFFDIVRKGVFLNNISFVNYPMILNQFYDIRIDVFKNNFKCFVNQKLMMDEYDFKNLFPKGTVALIMWEDKGLVDIKGATGPMYIYKLYED